MRGGTHRRPLLSVRLRLAVGALLSVVAALVLSGCFDMTTRVYADGRIKREVTIRVTEGRESGARVYLRETFPRAAGWSLKEVPRGGEVWFIATSRPVDPKDDPWGGRATLEINPEGQLQTSLLYTETLTDEILFRSDKERAGFDHLVITYTIEMPGRIDEEGEPPILRPLDRYRPVTAQGAEESAEAAAALLEPSFQVTQRVSGSRVTWDVPLAALAPHGVQVKVKAIRLNRAKVSLWSIVGVVGLILLYFVVVRLLVWRRIRAERAAELRELEEAISEDSAGGEEADGSEAVSSPRRWWSFARGGAGEATEEPHAGDKGPSDSRTGDEASPGAQAVDEDRGGGEEPDVPTPGETDDSGQ